MNEFKVGERYKVGGNGCETGNVIEIINVEEIYVYYKRVDGEQKDGTVFDKDSPFAKSLLPIPNRYEIHITCFDGKTTNAVYKVNGKVVERSRAICAPSDTFDFVTGAMVAFKRVIGYNTPEYFNKTGTTQPEPQENKPKYEVGQRVRIRNAKSGCMGAEGRTGTITDREKTNGLLAPEEGINVLLENGSIWRVNIESIVPYTEPEQPKYYNGKVLCYNNSRHGGNSGVASFYQGKVYEVKDGFLTDEQGTKRPMCKEEVFHSFEELNRRYCNSFSEYKGEAQC